MDTAHVGRVAAWTVGVGRALTGLAFLAAPDQAAQRWVGDDADRTRYLVRAVGGRDLALGAGVLAALVGRGQVRFWLVASTIADAADALSSPMLDGSYRTKTAGIAGGFGVLGAVAAALVED